MKVLYLPEKKKVWVRKPSTKPIEMTLTEFVKKYGQVNSYEFQDQYIAKIISSPITLDEIRGAGIWYAVSTDNPEGDNFYIQLETPGLKDSRAQFINRKYCHLKNSVKIKFSRGRIIITVIFPKIKKIKNAIMRIGHYKQFKFQQFPE